MLKVKQLRFSVHRIYGVVHLFSKIRSESKETVAFWWKSEINEIVCGVTGCCDPYIHINGTVTHPFSSRMVYVDRKEMF